MKTVSTREAIRAGLTVTSTPNQPDRPATRRLRRGFAYLLQAVRTTNEQAYRDAWNAAFQPVGGRLQDCR